MRSAALSFFSGLLNRVDSTSLYLGVPQEIFDAIARASVRTYEGTLTLGHLIVAPKEYAGSQRALTFRDSIHLSDNRGLRKLLELTGRGLALHCDSTQAYGLVRVEKELGMGECIEVNFTGRGKWTVSTRGTALMVVEDRIPALPKPVVDQDRIRSDLRRIFPDITSDPASAFVDAVCAAATQSHGSLIVVVDDADSEAQRLGREGIPIVSSRISADSVSDLTSIDGALLCSPDGNCHAIGVILDGIAAVSGNRARGARYNSAVRYVSTRKQVRAMAVVISEDGGVDLIPALRPVLKRELIRQHFLELKTLVDARSTDWRRQLKLAKWLENHSFYLSQDECREGNSLIAIADGNRATAFPGAIRISRTSLQPHADFDATRDLG